MASLSACTIAKVRFAISIRAVCSKLTVTFLRNPGDASTSADFLDAQGKHLFTLKKKLISLRGSHEAVGPDGKLLFEVKGKFGSTSIPSLVHLA